VLPVEHELLSVKPDAFDGLVLPGGVTNPDALRVKPKAVAFLKHFVDTGRPIAAICHGPWTLIEANGVRGRRMKSWPSLQTDLRDTGAKWHGQEVVRDGILVTSQFG
jgi:protease I